MIFFFSSLRFLPKYNSTLYLIVVFETLRRSHNKCSIQYYYYYCMRTRLRLSISMFMFVANSVFDLKSLLDLLSKEIKRTLTHHFEPQSIYVRAYNFRPQYVAGNFLSHIFTKKSVNRNRRVDVKTAIALRRHSASLAKSKTCVQHVGANMMTTEIL